MTDEMTEVDKNVLISGLRLTWDAVGMDAIKCAADAEGVGEMNYSMPRDDVVEWATECYLEMYGQVPQDVLKKFRALSLEEQHAFAKEVFTCDWYVI